MTHQVLRSVLLLSLGGTLAAQEAQFDSTGRDRRISVGARVRFVRDTGTAAIEGRVLSLIGDSIDVEDRSSLVRQRVSLRDLTRLEVRRRDSGLMTVLGVAGMVTSAGVFIDWCLSNRDECHDFDLPEENDWDEEDEDNQQFSLLSLAAVTGLFVGRAVGYLLTPPSWHRIERPIRVGVLPTHRGAIFYAAIRY